MKSRHRLRPRRARAQEPSSSEGAWREHMSDGRRTRRPRRDSVDYPDFASQVPRAVSKGECAAGRAGLRHRHRDEHRRQQVPGRAGGPVPTEFEARMARAHNDANVLCLGQRVVGAGVGRAILEASSTPPSRAAATSGASRRSATPRPRTRALVDPERPHPGEVEGPYAHGEHPHAVRGRPGDLPRSSARRRSARRRGWS